MSNKKVEPSDVTDWFSCLVKPVREGWYECRYDNTKDRLPPMTTRRYWNGSKWTNPEGLGGVTVCFFGASRDDKWRGLRRPA